MPMRMSPIGQTREVEADRGTRALIVFIAATPVRLR